MRYSGCPARSGRVTCRASQRASNGLGELTCPETSDSEFSGPLQMTLEVWECLSVGSCTVVS